MTPPDEEAWWLWSRLDAAAPVTSNRVLPNVAGVLNLRIDPEMGAYSFLNATMGSARVAPARHVRGERRDKAERSLMTASQ
jgi:hypothetical protein